MTMTIRIFDKDKQELDKLQQQILQKTGKKLSHDQIIHYLLKHTKFHAIKAIINELERDTQNIDWEANFQLIDDLGETNAHHIDEIIYKET